MKFSNPAPPNTVASSHVRLFKLSKIKSNKKFSATATPAAFKDSAATRSQWQPTPDSTESSTGQRSKQQSHLSFPALGKCVLMAA